jgi:hypothetical protein
LVGWSLVIVVKAQLVDVIHGEIDEMKKKKMPPPVVVVRPIVVVDSW